MTTTATAPRTSAGRRRPRHYHRVEISRRQRVILGTIGVFGVLLFWQLASSFGILNKTLGSSPLLMLQTAASLTESGVLGAAALSSGQLFATGFAIAAVLGVLIGIVLGWFSRTAALLDPWVSILYATPRIAFVPLIIVWAGVGIQAQIVMVVLNAVFPIIVNVAAGVHNTDRQFLRVARSFNAGTFAVLRTVALPGAVPFIITGIRQGIMMALVGTVVAEYFVGNTGIGGLIFTAGVTLDTATAFVGAAIFAIAALILSSALGAVESRVDGWRS